ncbi:MAG TPA: APC family permease [Methylocella sp.]|nr:APC family permease [Methylocella sp.]
MNTQHSLKHGALSFLDTAVMAVAGSAPAYSITASSSALIAAVGLASPATLLIAFFPMAGISLAFSNLNRWRSDAGAAYAWVGRAMHPALGFIAGWALLSLSTIFMVAAALPAAEATLELVAPAHLHDVRWATGIGIVWFLAVLTLVNVGITATARVQLALALFEVGALIIISAAAIFHAHTAPAAFFSWDWFWPSSFASISSFSAGMLVSVFYYFGWDVSANLAEETANAKHAAGLGGIIGVAVIVALFLLAQVAAQMALSGQDIEANAGDLLPALGQAGLGATGSACAILAVMLSTIATLQTQLVQCTRLLFSMARDRVIAAPMGWLHPRFQTPWLAGIAVAGVALCLFAASATMPSVKQLMGDLINAIGIQVSFYYSLAGIACAWYYRNVMFASAKPFIFLGLIPLASAVFVACVGLYELPQLGLRVSAISMGTIALGIIPLTYYRRHYRSRFYTDPPEAAGARRTP